MIAVTFHPNENPRIYEGINLKDWESVPYCLIDPEIPPGIPPHHWKMDNGKIIAMSLEEINQKDFTERNHQKKDHRVTSFKFTDSHYTEMRKVSLDASKSVVYLSLLASLFGAFGGCLLSRLF